MQAIMIMWVQKDKQITVVVVCLFVCFFFFGFLENNSKSAVPGLEVCVYMYIEINLEHLISTS